MTKSKCVPILNSPSTFWNDKCHIFIPTMNMRFGFSQFFLWGKRKLCWFLSQSSLYRPLILLLLSLHPASSMIPIITIKTRNIWGKKIRKEGPKIRHADIDQRNSILFLHMLVWAHMLYYDMSMACKVYNTHRLNHRLVQEKYQ